MKGHLRYLRPGTLVAVNGKLQSYRDRPTHVLADHLDVLSEAEDDSDDATALLDVDALETCRLDDDSTARVNYDGHTRKV